MIEIKCWTFLGERATKEKMVRQDGMNASFFCTEKRHKECVDDHKRCSKLWLDERAENMLSSTERFKRCTLVILKASWGVREELIEENLIAVNSVRKIKGNIK